MEKNKWPKTIVLLLAFMGVLITLLAYSIGGILSARKTMEQYRNRVSVMKPVSRESLALLEGRAENLRGLESIRESRHTGEGDSHSAVKLSVEEKTNLVRELLRTRSIGIERFRINSRDGGSEFVLHCPPVPFFGFLAELEEKAALEPDYISIKPGSGFSTINVTVRFNHVP